MNPLRCRSVAFLPAGTLFLGRQVASFLEFEELQHSSNHDFCKEHVSDIAVAEAQGVIFDAVECNVIVGESYLSDNSEQPARNALHQNLYSSELP